MIRAHPIAAVCRSTPLQSGRNRIAVVAFALCLALLTAAYLPRTLGSGMDTRGLSLNHPRVSVLKSARRLHLYDGDRLIRIYPIDLGMEPMGDKFYGEDRRTPEGAFRVCTKISDSTYHRFLGIDYPGEQAIKLGLRENWISTGQAEEIRRARKEQRTPRWDTPLGGGVGLHGHRRGQDWTAGCIALDDEHIEELFAVLRVGDEIEILP